jgi:hypothetical protein
VAVIDGLGAGVRVVLEGGANLRPGMQVKVAADAAQRDNAAMVSR